MKGETFFFGKRKRSPPLTLSKKKPVKGIVVLTRGLAAANVSGHSPPLGKEKALPL